MSNERHPGSERGLRRVCPPLRYVSSGAQIGAKRRKADKFQNQAYPSYVVPEFRVLAAETGLPLWIYWAPTTEKGPHGYERLGAPSGKEVGEHARQKKKYITIWWPAVYQSGTQIQYFPSPFFRLWAPRSPETLRHLSLIHI